MSDSHFIGDFLLGAALLVVCSAARLHSPQADRSYTPLFRFFVAVACYATVYIGVYSLIFGFATFSEHVVTGDARRAVELLDDIPGWIALLILIISHIPPVSGWDRALRGHAHAIGGIPSEALILRDAIVRARCETEEPEVYFGALRRGLDLGNLQAIPDHTLHGLLKHAAQLRYILDRCAQNPRFEAFVADNSSLAHDLKRRFDNLLFRTSRGFTALGELNGLVDRASGVRDSWNSLGSLVQTEIYTGSSAVLDPAIGTSRALLSFLRDDARAFLNDTALLLARLTFHERVTERGRVALLHSIGIQVGSQARPGYHILATAFVVVLALLCFGTVVFGARSSGGAREAAGSAVMVATMFAAALLCAIYPKQYFAFANVNAFGRRPYRFFAVAGLAAVVAAFIIGLVARMLIYQDAEKALQVAYQRSPWLLVSCVLAILMAILVQDTDYATTEQRKTRRWRDAGVLALGLAAAAATVILILRLTNPQDPQSAITVWAACYVGAIGGILGYMVPHRFRKVCLEPDPIKLIGPGSDSEVLSGEVAPR